MGDRMEMGKWLRARGKPARRVLALTVALGEGSGLLMVAQTALLVRVADAVIFPAGQVITAHLVALPLVIVARAVLAWGSRRAAAATAAVVKRELRADLLDALGRVGPHRLTGRKAGEVATTWVDAVESLDPFFSRYLPQLAIASLLPLTVLAIVFPLDWISGLVLVATAVFLPLNLVIIGQEAHAKNQALWATIARLAGRFLDILQGLTTVRLFGAARAMADEIERASREHRLATMSTLRVAFVSAFMLELLAAVSIAIVAVTCGFRLLSGGLTFAPAYFILLAAPEYFLSIRALGTSYHARMEAVSAATHVRALLDEGSPATPDTRDAALPRPAPATAPTVELRDVSLTFPTGAVLTGLRLNVTASERLAIVGPSGAGKSTILGLLLGFLRPDTGSVLVDGEPLASIDPAAWLRRIAWLPQRPTLFHGTLRHNLTLGAGTVTTERLESAIHDAGLEELIRRLPQGLDTSVGEGGQGLSSGQIQRVALARVALRDPVLLLLDEPTAHLDTETAEVVTRGLYRLTRGRTTIVVTHRPLDATFVDRTLALRDGRLGGAA